MCVTCTLSSEKKGGRRLETESLTLMWVVEHNKKPGGAYLQTPVSPLRPDTLAAFSYCLM